MGIFSKLAKTEKRSSLLSDPNHWIALLTGIFQSSAGVRVTPQVALATSAVFACVRVIAETIASLPLMVYRRDGDSKKLADNHPLYPLLHNSPNPWQTAFEFFEMQIGHCCLRGNAYNVIVRSMDNQIKGFVPLNPDRMQIEVDGSFDEPRIEYVYTPDSKFKDQTVTFNQDEIWHLKGMSGDGIMGYSVLKNAQEAIGLAVAAEKHGSKYFANGARPSGIAKTPGKLSEPARKNLKESIHEAISGDNAFKVLLLEQGLEWTQIGINNVDSQFLETRKFQVEEIARIFRVPTNLIGHTDKTATYASAEHFDIAFVRHCIRPWLVRVEKSINKNLFGEKQGRKYFSEFKVDGLLRADTKSRYEAYSSALQNEWMTRNEVRALENLNPVEGGDEFKNPAINPVEPPKDDQKQQKFYFNIDNKQPEIELKQPNINVTTPDIHVTTPPVNVDVHEKPVQMPLHLFIDNKGKVKKRVVRNSDGEIIGVEEKSDTGSVTKRIIRDKETNEIIGLEED